MKPLNLLISEQDILDNRRVHESNYFVDNAMFYVLERDMNNLPCGNLVDTFSQYQIKGDI